MLSVPRHLRSARWPFWLLLAAWFCANSPQAATYEVIAWLAKARNFSHQQRLTADVAFILGGQPAAAVVATAAPEPVQPHPVPVPAEATLKKFDLFVVSSSELVTPAVNPFTWKKERLRLPASPGREPPGEPPRAV